MGTNGPSSASARRTRTFRIDPTRENRPDPLNTRWASPPRGDRRTDAGVSSKVDATRRQTAGSAYRENVRKRAEKVVRPASSARDRRWPRSFGHVVIKPRGRLPGEGFVFENQTAGRHIPGR